MRRLTKRPGAAAKTVLRWWCGNVRCEKQSFKSCWLRIHERQKHNSVFLPFLIPVMIKRLRPGAMPYDYLIGRSTRFSAQVSRRCSLFSSISRRIWRLETRFKISIFKIH